MMKKWIHQEDTIIMNLYEPTTEQNNKTIKETNKSKIIVKNFNISQTPLPLVVISRNLLWQKRNLLRKNIG